LRLGASKCSRVARSSRASATLHTYLGLNILTKRFKYLVLGVIVNFVILFIGAGYLVVAIALSYEGRCGVFYFFGGEGRPCPLHEYMKEELGFAIAGLLEVWWLLLLAFPAFLVIPGIAYLIGLRRNSFNSLR